MDHMLEDPEDPVIEFLQVFGHRVRHGHYYSRMYSVRAYMVASVWHDIAETHLLGGCRDPRKPPGLLSRELEKRLSRMLHYYGCQDPPP